jgi:hypothetical protein
LNKAEILLRLLAERCLRIGTLAEETDADAGQLGKVSRARTSRSNGIPGNVRLAISCSSLTAASRSERRRGAAEPRLTRCG